MADKGETAVIVGAGIVGVSTAIWLQRAGFDVTLVDREGFAAGTSFGNAGILASSGVVPVPTPGILAKAPGMLLDPNEPLFLKWSYLPKLIPFLRHYLGNRHDSKVQQISRHLAMIMHDSVQQHEALANGTRAAKYVQHCDYVHVYKARESFEKDAYGLKLRRDNGFDYEELDAKALAEYDPACASRFRFAVRYPGHGRVTDPGAYVTALGQHFVEQGGKLVIAQVDDVIVEGSTAKAISTSQGEVTADHFVLAAGAWSTALAKKLGVKIHMESERGYHVEFVGANINLRSPIMVSEYKFAINSMLGRLRCAGIVEFGGLNAPPSKAPVELLKRQAREIFPDLEYETTREWLGHRPSTADSLPLIGAFRHVPNVWAGFGHQHLGVTGGPKTGRWLAQLIAGKMPNADMTPYAPDRF